MQTAFLAHSLLTNPKSPKFLPIFTTLIPMRPQVTPLIVTLAALFLGSCSGVRYTSATAPQDDLYAKPGDAPLYATRTLPLQQQQSQQSSMPNVGGNQGYSDFDQQRAADAQSYYGQPQSQPMQDADGNTYVTNNYYGNSSSFLNPNNTWGSPWRSNNWSYLQFLPSPTFFMPRSYFMDPWIYPYAFVAPRWGFGFNLGFGNFYGRPNWGWNQWGYGGGNPWFNDPFYYNSFYGWGGGGCSPWFDPYYGIGFYNGYNQGFYNGFYNGYQAGLYGNQWGWGGSQINNNDGINGGGGTIKTYGPRRGFAGTVNRTLVRAEDVNKRLVASQDPASTQRLRDERTKPERMQTLAQAPIGGMDPGLPTRAGSTVSGRGEVTIPTNSRSQTNTTTDAVQAPGVRGGATGGSIQPSQTPPSRVNESQYQTERQQSVQFQQPSQPSSGTQPTRTDAPAQGNQNGQVIEPYSQRIPERTYYERARQNQPSPPQRQENVSRWNTGSQPSQSTPRSSESPYTNPGAPSDPARQPGSGGGSRPDLRQPPSNNSPQRQSTPRIQSSPSAPSSPSRPSRSSGSYGGGNDGGGRSSDYSAPSRSGSSSGSGSGGGSSSPSRSGSSTPSGRGR